MIRDHGLQQMLTYPTRPKNMFDLALMNTSTSSPKDRVCNGGITPQHSLPQVQHTCEEDETKSKNPKQTEEEDNHAG